MKCVPRDATLNTSVVSAVLSDSESTHAEKDSEYVDYIHTGRLERVSHRIWRETKAAAKQSQFKPSNQLLLRSLHYLCDILSSHPVETLLLLRANFGIQRHFTIYPGQGPRRPL